MKTLRTTAFAALALAVPNLASAQPKVLRHVPQADLKILVQNESPLNIKIRL